MNILNRLNKKYNNIIKKELKLNNNYSLIDYFIDLLNIKILDNESLCLNNKIILTITIKILKIYILKYLN